MDLLKLLINASSNKNSIISDCFCGSGTTLKAAKDLDREWIGIDKSEEAINAAMKKLKSKQKTLNIENEFEYLEQIFVPSQEKNPNLYSLKLENKV